MTRRAKSRAAELLEEGGTVLGMPSPFQDWLDEQHDRLAIAAIVLFVLLFLDLTYGGPVSGVVDAWGRAHMEAGR